MTTERPEALRLASDIAASGQFTNLFTLDAAAAELRTQHARVTELESQLAQRFDAATERAADRAERGLSINLNHSDYYIVIEPPKDTK